MKTCLELFLTFLKMGCITFGGGYAMVPVLEREIINKKGWITMDEVMDYYTIAQVTPGIIAVNVATFIGYKRAGIVGGTLATIAFILPGVSLVTLIAVCLESFADYPVVRSALAGIRVAVGAIILDMVLKLIKGLFMGKKDAEEPNGRRAFPFFALVVFTLAFSLSAFLSASPVLLVIAAAIAAFFRGFLKSGAGRSRKGDWGADKLPSQSGAIVNQEQDNGESG